MRPYYFINAIVYWIWLYVSVHHMCLCRYEEIFSFYTTNVGEFTEFWHFNVILLIGTQPPIKFLFVPILLCKQSLLLQIVFCVSLFFLVGASFILLHSLWCYFTLKRFDCCAVFSGLFVINEKIKIRLRYLSNQNKINSPQRWVNWFCV